MLLLSSCAIVARMLKRSSDFSSPLSKDSFSKITRIPSFFNSRSVSRTSATSLPNREMDFVFRFHQTGSYLIRGEKEYHIPREEQEAQAHRAGIDYDPMTFSRGNCNE